MTAKSDKAKYRFGNSFEFSRDRPDNAFYSRAQVFAEVEYDTLREVWAFQTP